VFAGQSGGAGFDGMPPTSGTPGQSSVNG
jgi:hypothetical protein